MSQQDDDTIPGHTGDAADVPHGVRVYAVTAAASAEILVHEISPGAAPNLNGESVWLSMMCDVPFFIITGVSGVVLPAPDPTAVSGGGSEDQQCIRIPADWEWMRKWERNSTKFRIIRDGGADGLLRVERVSFIAGATNKGV